MRKNIYRGCTILMCAAALTFGATACSGNKTAETTAAAETTEAAGESESAPNGESSEIEIADAPSADQSSTEAKRGEEPITVEPLASSIKVDGSMDAAFSASFAPAKDISKGGDAYTLSFTGYAYEQYEAPVIAMLRSGDTIVMGGESVLIDTIEESDGVYMINGGLDEGGHDLIADEDNTYRERGYDDIHTYAELGKATLPIADSCVITDNSDLDNQGKKLTIEELMADDNANHPYDEYNTMITVKNGSITEITRSYTP